MKVKSCTINQAAKKHTRQNNKISILSWVSAASIVVSFPGVSHAQYKPLLNPLPANNPAAKLDPKLLNVQPMPMPKATSAAIRSAQSVPPTEVGYNVRTRSAKVGATRTQALRLSSKTFSPGNSGANANIKPEPRKGKPALPGTIRPSSVIGWDDRIQIDDTTAYPWRTMTKLFMTFPNGESASCSGTLISAKYVLTAGHCIYDAALGGWASSIEVVPGLNNTYKPYGSAYATYMRSFTNYTDSGDSNYDFALVTLDRNIGDSTGWLGYGYFPSINGVTGYLAGYPGDLSGGLGLYFHYAPISSSTVQRVEYTIDTAGGQSGSGVYHFYDFGSGSERYVFAVHTNGDIGWGTNSGTRIDSEKYDFLQSWMSSGF